MIVGLIVGEAQVFGIFAILALGLNLEYGYTGIPNFGKVFFMGIGAIFTGSTVAHLINWVVSQSTLICPAAAAAVRDSFAFSSPGILSGIFILTIIISALITGAFGYLLSYPALRLREDYFGILMIATGELSRVFTRASPANIIACESDSLISIPSPVQWLRNFAFPFTPRWSAPFDWVTASNLVDTATAAIILAFTVVCYLIVSRLSNSPYGRMLKSVRDDEQAAISLGKDPAKIRGQVMIIGSAMAGVAGALFAFKYGAIDTSSFITLITFQTFAILILGGSANNRGVILGAIAFVSIDFLTFLVKTFLETTYPEAMIVINARAPVATYAQQIALGVIIILIILFRPQGILREKPIKTPAWDVLRTQGMLSEKPIKTPAEDVAENGSNSKDKQPR